MTGKEFIHKFFSPFIWINMLGMTFVILLACLGIIFWMNSYTHHGEGVDVPNVKGILYDDAQFELRALDLDAIVNDSIYDKRLAPGVVVDQTPGPGSRVKSGREIYLTINAKNEPTLPLPQIIDNCSRREAEAKLMSLGFKVGPVEFVEGTKDYVLGAKSKGKRVKNGDRISLEAPVTLIVGNSELEFDENEIVVDDNWHNEAEEEDGGESTQDELVF